MRHFARLAEIQNDRTVTPKEDMAFLWNLEQAALLALKEDGSLTETQFRAALEALKKAYRAAAGHITDAGEAEC